MAHIVILGAGTGLLVGLAMGAWPGLHRQLDPLVALVHPIPKIALLPLILVVFGIGETSKIVLAALGSFFPMLINTVAGVRQINPTYFEVARSCGASHAQTFRRVVVPGSLPMVLTGARLAVNFAVILTMGDMLAPALASIVIAYLLEGLVAFLEKYGSPRLAAASFARMASRSFLDCSN